MRLVRPVLRELLMKFEPRAAQDQSGHGEQHMTIKELIEELSKYNEDLEVLIETSNSDEVDLEPRIVLSHMKSGRTCLLFEI
jgi:hypothetical protein